MSGSTEHRNVSYQRLTEAAEWLMRVQGDESTPNEVSAWLEWCSAHPENLEAFERVQDLYDHLGGLQPAGRARFMALAPHPSPHGRAGGGVKGYLPLRIGERVGVRGLIIAAAAAAASVVGFVFWSPWSQRPVPSEQHEYRAQHGAKREVVLADRSRITLASASIVASRYSPTQRLLELEDGEAYFEVRPDRSRPFVVRAGAVTVTAVGTAFNVRRTNERTVVSVTEGLVDVLTSELPESAGTPPSADRSAVAAPVRLQAGQQAVHATNLRGLMVATIAPDAAIAWQKGRLEYVAEPLGSVIDDVNRYVSHPIVVDDPTVRALIFSGTVFEDQADEWVQALDSVFPVRVATRGDGRVTLEPRPDAAQSGDFR